MPEFEALYYPNFEPPERWLRSNLLFFDKIRTIVPDDVDFKPSKKISEIVNSDTFETISPKPNDITMEDLNLTRMRKAFSLIKEQQDNTKTIKIKLDGAEMQISGYTFLHDGKVSKEVGSLLDEFGLIKNDFRIALRRMGIGTGNGNFHIVNTKAADLIVSLVADKIGRHYGWNTITDKSIDFMVNALDSFNSTSRSETGNMLISSIISCEIPQEIQNMSPTKYLELRDAYSDIRKPFHRVIVDLSNLYRLEAIEDRQTLQKRIMEITSDFNTEVEKFKKSSFGLAAKRWVPIGIGALASITAAAFDKPEVAIGSTVVSVIIQVVQEFMNKERQSEESHVQKLIAKMEKDILKASDIKRLI